ncbi:hypothetical protein BDR06DRAFT_1011631 [Suillus hirtellus]|nr:hypothetical protein BDR06DRAFT_1011631 [Suillus hirtellus]
MDFDENLDQSFPDDEAQGDSQQVDPDGKITDMEHDEVYDVLERHHAKNRQRKAPSPNYLLKGKAREYAGTFNRSESPQQCPSQHGHSKSSRPRSPQCINRSESPQPSKSPRRYPSSGGVSAVRSVQRHPPARHPHCSSRSKSPRRQQSSQPVRYARASSSRTQSPLRRPSRPVTSSSRSHTQPTSRGCSPSRSPSESTLAESHEHSRSATPKDAHRSGNGKRKVKTSQENPLKLGFYPPTWQVFLQAAKLEMQSQAILSHPIPESQDALSLAREVLDAVLWIYHEKKNKLKRGYFLEYDIDMCRLLCDDLFTFCTELKKVIIPIAKRAYDIFPQGSTTQKEEAQKHVTATAARLLKSSDYLRLPDLSGGSFKNFTSQALKDTCLKFYYSNSKKALKNTDKFHRTIPINAMLLVAAVLKSVISGFRETGTDKVPDLTAEQCRIHFVNLWKSVDKLLDIPEHCDELGDMLDQWARIGMGNFDGYAAGSATGSDAEDINIIL